MGSVVLPSLVELVILEMKQGGLEGNTLAFLAGELSWECVRGEVVNYRVQLIDADGEEVSVNGVIRFADGRFTVWVARQSICNAVCLPGL